MANEGLFNALAVAKSQPSHAYRAAIDALDIPRQAIEGYESGLEAKQKIGQYKLLNTKLGDVFGANPIPYNLSPDHTVKDLMTIAPAMQNYIPGDVIKGIASGYGANTGDSSPSPAPATLPPPPPAMPSPSPTPGQGALAQVGGDGSFSGGNVAPGAPIPQPGPVLKIPPGGMNDATFKLVEPALKAAQQERLDRMRLSQEKSLHDQAQAAEESRFERGQDLTREGKEGEFRKDYGTSQASTMSGLDAYKQLDDAWNAVPDSQKGPGMGAATSHFGDITSGRFPEVVAYNKARKVLAGAIAAGIDPKGRQGPALLDKIQEGIPTLGQSGQARNNLMGTLYNQISSAANRNYEEYKSAAGSTGGSVPKPNIPPRTSTTGNPEADAAIQKIQNSNLNPGAKRARINAVMARLNG